MPQDTINSTINSTRIMDHTSGRKSTRSAGGGARTVPETRHSGTGRRRSAGRSSAGGSAGGASGPSSTAVPLPDDSDSDTLAAVPEGVTTSGGSLRNMSREEHEAQVKRISQSRRGGGAAQYHGARTADILFLVDCTASMDPFAKAAAQTVGQVLDAVSAECGGVATRASIVGYRDHCESMDHRYEFLDFTDDIGAVRDKMTTLAESGCFGGGDGPEDIHGGLNEALGMTWRSNARIIVHIADAPCHGRRFHDFRDDHPDGFKGWTDSDYDLDPDTMTAERLLEDLVLQDINYCFLKITSHTEKMLSIFRDIYRSAAKGTKMHFTIADLGGAPDESNAGAWKDFTARFASLVRGTLKDSINSARPGAGGEFSIPDRKRASHGVASGA